MHFHYFPFSRSNVPLSWVLRSPNTAFHPTFGHSRNVYLLHPVKHCSAYNHQLKGHLYETFLDFSKAVFRAFPWFPYCSHHIGQETLFKRFSPLPNQGAPLRGAMTILVYPTIKPSIYQVHTMERLMHCTAQKHIVLFHFPSKTLRKAPILFPILQMKKLRLEKISTHPRYHCRASPKSTCLMPEPTFLSLCLAYSALMGFVIGKDTEWVLVCLRINVSFKLFLLLETWVRESTAIIRYFDWNVTAIIYL